MKTVSGNQERRKVVISANTLKLQWSTVAEKTAQANVITSSKKEDKKENISSMSIVKSKKAASYNPIPDLIFLATLVRSGQVRGLRVKLQSKMIALKKCGEDPREIAVAVTAVSKVLRKASIKVKKLEEEERLQKKQKKAEKTNHMEEAKKIEREIKQRQKARKLKEQQDIIEAKKEEKNGTYTSKAEVTSLPDPIFDMISAASEIKSMEKAEREVSVSSAAGEGTVAVDSIGGMDITI